MVRKSRALAYPGLMSPVTWPGGKSSLAPKIVARMPGHTHYCEPFAGGLSTLFAKDPTDVSEVVNDLDGRVSLFWSVLRDPSHFAEFVRLAHLTPVSEPDWDLAHLEALAGVAVGTPAARAYRFFLHCRQSMAGRMEVFTALAKERTRRGMNAQVSAWLSAVEGLPEVHARLIRVAVRNRDALQVIRQEDSGETLYYLDPPYLLSTRTTLDLYGRHGHEMTDAQHAQLLKVLTQIKGKFLLSGYRSEMYDGTAARFGWRREDFDVAQNGAGGRNKRRVVESLWANF